VVVRKKDLKPDEIKKYYGDRDKIKRISRKEDCWEVETVSGKKMVAYRLVWVHHQHMILLELNHELFVTPAVIYNSIGVH
jgi:hypothetical protein